MAPYQSQGISPAVAGLLVDAVALICITVLAVTHTVPAAAVLPVISAIVAARLSQARKNPGEGSGDGPYRESPGHTKAPDRPMLRLAQASGLIALLFLIPILIEDRYKG